MIIIPTGPSLVIHGLVIASSKFFPSFLIRYKKTSTGAFGFIFVALYLIFVTSFLGLLFYYLFTSQNNISHIYKIAAAFKNAEVKPVNSIMIADALPLHLLYDDTLSADANLAINSAPASAEVLALQPQENFKGATSVPTGLANNPFADSFFIPLLIGIIGAWLFKSGFIRVFTG